MSKSNEKDNVGKIGEDIACAFLVKNKYKILFRNYREKFDEIDIIAKSFNGTLVFVEVKTLKENPGGLIPEDNLTKDKFKKISRACRLFANSHKELVGDRGWKIDLIAVTIRQEGNDEISHYKNITTQ